MFTSSYHSSLVVATSDSSLLKGCLFASSGAILEFQSTLSEDGRLIASVHFSHEDADRHSLSFSALEDPADASTDLEILLTSPSTHLHTRGRTFNKDATFGEDVGNLKFFAEGETIDELQFGHRYRGHLKNNGLLPLLADLSEAFGRREMFASNTELTAPFHAWGMLAAGELGRTSAQDEEDVEVAATASCRNCCGANCLGMCGKKCDCWSWVCGNCDFNRGCYKHDLECGNYWSWKCISAYGVLYAQPKLGRCGGKCSDSLSE